MPNPPISQPEELSEQILEQELRQSLKALSDIKFALDESAIVAMTDADGVITYVNDTFCKVSKYTREELLGKTHRVVRSGYHPKGFFKQMWETLRRGETWRGEICNRAKDGSHYWVETTIVPFLGEDGKPYQYIAIRSDISDRKRFERELRELNEDLENRVLERTRELESINRNLQEALLTLAETERQREIFINALTHDLRTPLVAEQRALELFQQFQQTLPPKLATLTTHLLKSNADLLDLVNKLLEAAHLEAGQVALDLDETCVEPLLAECLQEVAPLAEKRQIRLESRIDPDLPEVLADRKAIKRVFMNLLGNALENLRPGDQVLLTARAGNGSVAIEVRDTGPGIPEDIKPHLFDRYHAVRRARKKLGAGLGLSICKMIVDGHGGTIRLESQVSQSQVDQGTAFFVELPCISPSVRRQEPIP